MKESNEIKSEIGNSSKGYDPALAISKFGGSKSVEEWLVDARCNVSFIDESRRAAFIKIHLRGDARL